MGKEMISAADQDRGRTQSMARLLASAERELSSFVAAVNELFDAELARQAQTTGWRSWNRQIGRVMLRLLVGAG